MDLSIGIKTTGKKARNLNLSLDSIHNILITGVTGSGKSFLLHQIIKRLSENNTPDEICFILVDPKRVEFSEYNISPYLYCPVIYDSEECLHVLEDIAGLAKKRFMGNIPADKAIVILIDECDPVYQDPSRFNKVWRDLYKYKEKSNVYIAFSSSRAGHEVFSPNLINHSNLKIACKPAKMFVSYKEFFGKDAVAIE